MRDNITAADDVACTIAERGPGRGRDTAPVVVEVRGVSKTFLIPEQKVDTIKERALHPFRSVDHRVLRALNDVSFDVHKGEFFGIVGRNGSGKSTLLKILSSIYRADAGTVRMAGRFAPFIELGVGLNPELSARENCALNGVLMGLGRREARRRIDSMIEFGELQDFVDLKVKNYSSGMMVRLAFSVMVQADADIMLIDEVLAVGDAAFGQKCMDVFYKKREAGKTIVLVTHDMSTVQSMCHRAMVIEEGELQYIGEPEQTSMRYYRLNFGREGVDLGELGEEGKPPPELPVALDLNARLVHARLRDEVGAPIANLEQGVPINVDVLIEAARDLMDPIFVFQVRTVEGVVVFAFTRTLREQILKGQRVRLAGEIENLLVPGSYTLQCWIRQDRQTGEMALQAVRLVEFVVYGTTPRHGLVSVRTDVEPVLEPVPGG